MPGLVRRLKEILNVYLADEAKARYLQPDGSYARSPQAKSSPCPQRPNGIH